MRRSNHEYSALPRMKNFLVLKTGFAGALLGAISLAVDPFSAAAAPAPGELLISRFECAVCHQPSTALQNRLLPSPAPRLGEAGARLSPQWIRDFLLQPQSEVPGTSMPDSLQSLPAAERPAAAEALSHYLASGRPRLRPPSRLSIRRPLNSVVICSTPSAASPATPPRICRLVRKTVRRPPWPPSVPIPFPSEISPKSSLWMTSRIFSWTR